MHEKCLKCICIIYSTILPCLFSYVMFLLYC